MRRALGILVVLFALLAAFSLLSFRVMSSHTARDTKLASYHATSTDGSAVPSPSVTTLRVEGESRLAQSVQKALAGALEEQPGLGSFQTAGAGASTSGAAATSAGAETPAFATLNVALYEQNVFCSPFYARAQLAVEVAYASNGDGDIRFRQQAAPHFVSDGNGPAIQFLGRYALADVSWGLISQPGYRDFLAGQIASAIVADMQEQLKVKD